MIAAFAALGLWAVPQLACAHADGADGGLVQGLLHPVFGLDHLLAMVCVGVVSAQRGGTDLWRLPATFVVAMVVGGLWGRFAGAATWSELVELGIAASLIVLGASMMAMPRRLPWTGIYACVALFGACHGLAHGAEMPKAASPLFYSVGFVISTSFLHVCGLLLSEVATMRRSLSIALRLGAVSVSGVGIVLLLHR